MLGCDRPDEFVVNVTVFVGENMALSNNAPPSDLRMSLLHGVRYAVGGLADDLDATLDGQPEVHVRLVLLEGNSADRVRNATSVLKHVPEECRIVGVKPHE